MRSKNQYNRENVIDAIKGGADDLGVNIPNSILIHLFLLLYNNDGKNS